MSHQAAIEMAAKAACCPAGCICGDYTDPRCAWRDHNINAVATVLAFLRTAEPSASMIDAVNDELWMIDGLDQREEAARDCCRATINELAKELESPNPPIRSTGE